MDVFKLLSLGSHISCSFILYTDSRVLIISIPSTRSRW